MDEGHRRAHWETIYATKAPDEVSWYQARPGSSLDLIRRTGKGHDARIIDVGGGASLLVDALLDAGFKHVTVLDISEGAIANATERLGERASRVCWVVEDIMAWTPDRTFDVWHDRALFHFLTAEHDRAVYRRALDAGVPAGGQVVIGTFALDGPEQCSGLGVTRYDAAGLASEIGPAYRLLETLDEDHVAPNGKVQRFHFCRFARL